MSQISAVLNRSELLDISGHGCRSQGGCMHPVQVPDPCNSKPPAQKAQLNNLRFPCLNPCRGGEHHKATWDVIIWKVAGEKAELGNKWWYRKTTQWVCLILVIAWYCKWSRKVVKSVVKMSRPALWPAGTLMAFVKMLKESRPFTWRQLYLAKQQISCK